MTVADGGRTMERGLGKRLSGIAFSRSEIEKSVTAKRTPSKFWRMSPYGRGVNVPESGESGWTVRKPCRDDMKITGSVLKKSVK